MAKISENDYKRIASKVKGMGVVQIMESDTYPLIVYLPYDEKKDLSAEPNHLRRWTLESVHEIHDKFDIKIDEKMLYSRMCVAFNKTLLTISKLPKQSNKIDRNSLINPHVIK